MNGECCPFSAPIRIGAADPRNRGIMNDEPNLLNSDPNIDRGPWCRMCQAEKRADNHWFETEEVVGWQGLEGLAQLVIRPLQLPLTKGRDPICGEGCLQKRVAIWAGAHLLPRPGNWQLATGH